MRIRYRYFSVSYGGKPTQIEQLQRGSWSWFHPMPSGREEVWRPPTDVYETDEHFVVKMELAGVKEDDMEVTIFNDVLVVAGIREDTDRPERVKYHEVSIHFGKFRSEVFLPIQVSPECIEARLENGMLTISLLKSCQP